MQHKDKLEGFFLISRSREESSSLSVVEIENIVCLSWQNTQFKLIELSIVVLLKDVEIENARQHINSIILLLEYIYLPQFLSLDRFD